MVGVWGRELCKDGFVWLVLYVWGHFCGCYGFRYALGFDGFTYFLVFGSYSIFVHCLGSGGF